MELLPNTYLQNGKYKIVQKVGQGGFGIAYKANQVSLNRLICIKEFYFADLCERRPNSSELTIISTSSEKIQLVNSFKKKFIKEAQRLAKFQHPNIVQVMDVFEENNTAYFVMEYLEGGSLDRLLEKEGKLTEKRTLEIIFPILDALELIHKSKLLHLDIKPLNIMFRNDRTPVLIDFGISKYMEIGSTNTTTAPVGISKGYAPLEQYGGNIADFSEATDIYSVCATLYKMVTGETPQEPLEMIRSGIKSPKNIKPTISDVYNSAIVKGLSIKLTDRHQTCSEVKNAFSTIKEASTIPKLVAKPTEPLKPLSAFEYFKRAETKRKEKKFREAVLDYTEAINLKNNEQDYYFYRGTCYYESRKYNEAINDFTKAIELNPNYYSSYFNRGLCFQNITNSEGNYIGYLDAINDYFKAIEIYNDKASYKDHFIDAIDFILKSDMSERTWNTIDELLNKYISNNWSYRIADIYYNRGRIKLKLKDKESGIIDLKKSIELDTSVDKKNKKAFLNTFFWYSPKIITNLVLVLLLNIIFSYTFFYMINHDSSGYMSWGIIFLLLFSGMFALTRSIPRDNYFNYRQIIHPFTPILFQIIERLILSMAHILCIALLIWGCVMATNNAKDASFLVIYGLCGLTSLIPLGLLRYIWKSSWL